MFQVGEAPLLSRPKRTQRIRMTTTTTLTSTLFLIFWACCRVQAAAPKPRSCDGGIRHVHLAVGPDPSTSMTVTFASFLSKFPASLVAGALVGKSLGSMTDVYLENPHNSPTHYDLSVDKKIGNFGDRYYSPYYHHVTMTGLEPNTVYYYQPLLKPTLQHFQKLYHIRNYDELYGSTIISSNLTNSEALLENSDQKGATEKDESTRQRRFLRWYQRFLTFPYDGSERNCPAPDKIRYFKTAPKPGPSSSVMLALMGDLGQFFHSQETMSSLLMDRSRMDTIILAGDLAYTTTDHRQWDTFFDFLDDFPVAEYVSMQVCPGNHDIDKIPDQQEIFLAYEHRFRMPHVHPPQLGLYDGPEGPLNMDQPPYPLPYEWGNAYYSYTYGPARILMLNAYSSMEPDSIQYGWLVQELEAVDRSVTPWVLAVIHTPFYNTFSLHRRDKQIVAAKKNLEPLLVKYQVNLVFSGHIHAYLRTANVALDELLPSAPIHITVGAGGRKCEAPFENAEPEPWVQVRDATVYGYGMLRLINATTAMWEWIHTGQADGRSYNQLKQSNQTLPPGPSRDVVQLHNQYFL